MGFSVNPTSGDLPYVFTASFSNRGSIESGLYVVEFITATASGSCPPASTTGANAPSAANALFNTGSYTQTINAVPAGSCRRYNLVLREVATGTVISSSNVTVSNI